MTCMRHIVDISDLPVVGNLYNSMFPPPISTNLALFWYCGSNTHRIYVNFIKMILTSYNVIMYRTEISLKIMQSCVLH